MSDGRITSQDLARWNPSSEFQAAKVRREGESDLEYRVRILEGALADMAYRLKFANECYANLQNQIIKIENHIVVRMKEELTSTEIQMLRDFYKELTS